MAAIQCVWVSCAPLLVAATLGAQTFQGRLRQGLAAGRHGDCTAALANLTPLVDKGLSSPEAFNVIAVCDSRLGHPREATTYFERIVRLEPEAWQAWNNLGGNYLALDHPSEAASAFHKSIQLDSGVASVWFNQASAFLKLGKQTDAFQSLDHAERLAPRDPQIRGAWLTVAGLLATQAADLINHKRYERAQNLLLETQRALSGSGHWNDLLGYAEFKLNRPKPALQHLQTALQLDPDNVDFLMDVGEFLAHYRAYGEAEKVFEVATKRMPDSPQVKFGLAVSYILENRRQQATHLLENLIASHPDFEPGYHALGQCYEDAGNGKGMVGLGKRLRMINKSNPTAWYLIGAGLLQESVRNRSLLKATIPALQHAVALDPDASRDHFVLGKAYVEERDYPRAAVELKETLRLDPEHNRAHYVLARVYQQLGEKKLAKAEFAAHNKIIKHESNADYRLFFTLAKRP